MVDRSKSIKTFLMSQIAACKSPGCDDVEGVDCYNACYGGTAAFLNVMNWSSSVAADGNRLGVVVCADIAPGSREAVFMAGAASVATLVGRSPA